MIDEHKHIQETLEDILPTYYEYILTNKVSFPCITFYEYRNQADEQSKNIGYSTVAYYVKIWSDDIETVQDKAQDIDKAMRAIGYKRTSSTEMIIDKSICKIFIYTARGFEDFRKEV